ncbi:nicotinate-nucleotide adenylyltransferase [Paludibacterium yongneupense]|uniref:nicotinate-nucleotide adenylyltransferase n=1 Tax=Paludibacterium yongneupense TaxID=400061 RepID=UPI0003FAC1F3|nr:nicotinate-nucleotide adenylyltransferase [Paludibacterium yongneupense]
MPDGVGIFGGTFDPIHLAHIRMARAFRDEIGLAELRLVPAGRPYHRQQPEHAAVQDRLTMVELAIAGEPGMVVDAREAVRDRPSYTYDTLAEVRSELGAERPLWFLIGADALAQLDRWHNWRQLFDLANLAVALRPGFNCAGLPPAIRSEWLARQVPDFPNHCASGTIRPLTLPPVELSATAIRERLARKQDISDQVAKPVLSYIEEHGLYRQPGGSVAGD